MSGKGGRNGLASDGVGRAAVVVASQQGLQGPMGNACREFNTCQRSKKMKRFKKRKKEM